MAGRFRRLLAHAAAGPARPEAPADEARTLSRARAAAQRRGEFRGLTIGYALATIALLALGLSGYRADRAFIIAAAFARHGGGVRGRWYSSSAAAWLDEWFVGSQFGDRRSA